MQMLLVIGVQWHEYEMKPKQSKNNGQLLTNKTRNELGVQRSLQGFPDTSNIYHLCV